MPYSGCDDGCLTDNQRLANIVGRLADFLISINPMSDCHALEVLDKCGPQCLTTGQLQVLLAELSACITESSAGGGSVLCGTSDPVDDPGVPCAIYYRTDTGEQWTWNDSTTTWDKILE